MPTELGARAAARMIVGSWPGREAAHNRFQKILIDALEEQGVRVVDFPDSRSIRLEGLDVLIIHWPEKVFSEAQNAFEATRLIIDLLRKIRARPPSVKVVWMVHNLRPHFVRGFKRLSWPWYSASLARAVDGALTLSEGTLETVRTGFPAFADKPVDSFWHPLYPGEGISPEIRASERAALGWNDASIVYGYCGQIRPSKGVEDLLIAFRALPDPSARLLVAGLPVYRQEMVKILTQLAGGDPRICLRLHDLTAEDFRASIGVCDLVVAPFRSYLHSGSLVHALSCHRPVLTPATPFATSLATHLASPGWVQTYEGALTPAVLAAAGRPQAPLDLAPLDPSLAAIRIVEFLERLIGREDIAGDRMSATVTPIRPSPKKWVSGEASQASAGNWFKGQR